MIHYLVSSNALANAGTALELCEGKNLFTGEKHFAKYFPNPTSLELDLLRIGGAIFAADRASARGVNESLTRSISVTVPVVNIGRLMPTRGKLERILHKLSDDYWKLELLPIGGHVEGTPPRNPTFGDTLLFSGGLDSLAAAVEFGNKTKPLQLISHRTRNQPTIQAQDSLAKILKKKGYNIEHRHFFVSSSNAPPSTFQHDIENSQRTRSFAFLILGSLAARRAGNWRILFLAENGQMAIHLPLTRGRMNALSTHTAHPEVIERMEDALGEILEFPLKITNPYLHRTKREVVEVVWNSVEEAIPISTSCWRNSNFKPPATHCGACIPCFVRRIAVEYHGKDKTRYAADIWGKNMADFPEDDDGRRNLVDLAEFVRRFELNTDSSLVEYYPELNSTFVDSAQVLKMYKRFAKEARKVWANYATPLALLA